MSAQMDPYAIKGIDRSGKSYPVSVRVPRSWTSNFIGPNGALGAAPINDECFQAIELLPSAICDLEYFTIAEATESLPGVLCNGVADPDAGDIWFRFTATAASHSIRVQGGVGIDPVIDLRSGACEGSSIACADETAIDGTEQIDALGLIVGQTYLIRVYDFFTPGEFDDPTIAICITGPTTTTVNDECTQAIELIPSATCDPQTFSIAEATQSLPPISCNGTTAAQADDVWFRFVATASSHSIFVQSSPSIDMVIDLRSGACEGASIACADLTNFDGQEQVDATGLTVGATYFVRVYDWFELSPSDDPEFTICITGLSSVPANDACASLTLEQLTVGSSLFFTGTTVGSTTAGDAVTSSVLDDGVPKVWYAFNVGTCANVQVSLCGTDPEFDAIYLRLARQCPANTLVSGALDAEGCADGNLVVNYNALEPGTYYVPVGRFGLGSTGAFDLTITATACGSGATNDECTSAIELFQTQSCEPSTFTSQDATESLPAITCNDFTGDANDDVWFSFIPTSPIAVIDVLGSSGYDAVVQLFTSGDCSGSTSYICSDDSLAGETERIYYGSFVVGQTYFLRVYDYSAGPPATPTFDICIHFGGDPPANDDCADVLPVVVQVGETITFNGTTVGAVPPEGSTEPYVYHAFTLLTCADVSWDLCGTDPMFNTLPLSLVDCPALEELSVGMADYTVCDGDIWGVDHLSLPAGTYFIPIPVDGGNYGDYTINLTANQCTVVATNDACDEAIVLPINTTCETISATTIGATQSAPPITCNGFTGSSNDDVWFTFQATSPNATIAVAGEANFDAVVELIGVGCEIPISLACADATIAGGNEGLVVNNLVPGTNYWVRVYHYWTEAPLGGFEICIVGDISTGIENGPSWSMSGGWNGAPFTIQWSMDPAPVLLEMLDMTGRSIWSGRYNMQTGPNTMEPLPASVASGNYLLLIDAGQGRSGQRFFLE
ncbi:MAG: hypothetical protein JNN32_11545 [Flavobacteriales bacterium]|nr:hypothetical protein [Flavobacteriales bacterium]